MEHKKKTKGMTRKDPNCPKHVQFAVFQDEELARSFAGKSLCLDLRCSRKPSPCVKVSYGTSLMRHAVGHAARSPGTTARNERVDQQELTASLEHEGVDPDGAAWVARFGNRTS